MEQQMHKSTQDARAGSTPHIVRYVLWISITLAAIAMAVVVLWGDAVSPDKGGAGSISTATPTEQPASQIPEGNNGEGGTQRAAPVRESQP